jgi:hypothetical protein|tara:strand:- start:58 stop:420 length:363 start_codon:yes stop_codon:yes gene_type:complete
MYHKNLDDTHDNVFIKFNVTPEEQRVVRKAARAYKVHRFKNRIIRDGARKWSAEETLKKYPDYFEEFGNNKLRAKGKVPSDILDKYFKKKKLPRNCKRWYELARCVMAIGEYQARSEMGL